MLFHTWMIAELCYQRLTVGKLYAGLLILENYRAKKSGAEVNCLPKSKAYLVRKTLFHPPIDTESIREKLFWRSNMAIAYRHIQMRLIYVLDMGRTCKLKRDKVTYWDLIGTRAPKTDEINLLKKACGNNVFSKPFVSGNEPLFYLCKDATQCCLPINHEMRFFALPHKIHCPSSL